MSDGFTTSPRITGTVKWFNDEKLIGYISPDDGTTDVFVSYKSIRTDGVKVLVEGDKVTFSVSEGRKGLQADDVEKI